jgi:hypothetical protein
MPVTHDRPFITLQLDANGDLVVNWGPKEGLWGIYNSTAPPEIVTIKEWWLYVGTRPNHAQAGPSQCEIVSQSVGLDTSKTIPKFLLPLHQPIMAYVIGYFDSKGENGQPIDQDGQPIVEGIYSDVEKIP